MASIGEIVERETLKAGRILRDSEKVAAVKAKAGEGLTGRLFPDDWAHGGELFVDDRGDLRIRGEHAAYKVERIEVTGRSLRYDAPTVGPSLRVRVTFANEEGIEGCATGAWLGW